MLERRRAPHQRAAVFAAADRADRRRAGRPDPARARLRHRGVAARGDRRDGVCRGHQLSLPARRRAARAAGALRDPDAGRLPPAAPADLHGSVGRSARRRLPDHPVADRRRHRRRVRQGPDERRAEAVLPAGAAHRLHLRGDLRRDRTAWRDPGAAVLLRDRAGAACARRCARPTASARSSRSASR